MAKKKINDNIFSTLTNLITEGNDEKMVLLNWKSLLENKDLDLESLSNNLPKSKIISRRQSLINIQSAYVSNNLVFVLGAGISYEFGVPTWNLLLQNLMVHTIKKENNVSNILSKLFNEIFSPNPLIAGRYLQDYFEKNNSSFESMVREVLYSKIDKDKESKLLNEIVKICVAPVKSPNLDSIITYNFDDILEYKINKTQMDIPYKSVYGLGIEIKNGELPIYHVHGYLPEKDKLDDSNKITFGESNYHLQYSDLYSWNNMVQINKFRDKTCLFIGSSLSDPNIRRLLDIALRQKGNKRKHHYIIKKRIDVNALSKKLKIKLESTDIFNEKNKADLNFDETIKLLTEIYERFEENDSSSFGVQTIWINDWEETPSIIKKMRENVA